MESIGKPSGVIFSLFGITPLTRGVGVGTITLNRKGSPDDWAISSNPPRFPDRGTLGQRESRFYPVHTPIEIINLEAKVLDCPFYPVVMPVPTRTRPLNNYSRTDCLRNGHNLQRVSEHRRKQCPVPADPAHSLWSLIDVDYLPRTSPNTGYREPDRAP